MTNDFYSHWLSMDFSSAAGIGAIADILPIASPFFTPGEWSLASEADLRLMTFERRYDFEVEFTSKSMGEQGFDKTQVSRVPNMMGAIMELRK